MILPLCWEKKKNILTQPCLKGKSLLHKCHISVHNLNPLFVGSNWQGHFSVRVTTETGPRRVMFEEQLKILLLSKSQVKVLLQILMRIITTTGPDGTCNTHDRNKKSEKNFIGNKWRRQNGLNRRGCKNIPNAIVDIK